MWQRPNSYYHHSELEDGLANTIVTVMVVGILLAYLLSVLVTRLILRYLVNPLLNDRLSEDDQLLLLMSSIIWIVVGGAVTLPTLLEQVLPQSQAGEVLTALIGSLLGFGAWGLLSGFGILIWMYWEVGSTVAWEPTHGFEDITGLPGEHYRPAALDTQSEPEMTLSEIEAMLRDDTDIERPNPSEDLARPVETVPAASKNEH